MQLASISNIPDGLIAATLLLKEKPSLGGGGNLAAPSQGIDERNCTAAIGLRASLLLNRVQSRYTGKERDTESGLDYFGARYYASNMGRFMSPDWAAKAEPVPYAKLDDPQSLNLYGYVGNNPLSRADADGHCPECEIIDAIEDVAMNHPALVSVVLAGIAGGGGTGAEDGAIGGSFVEPGGGTAVGAVLGGVVGGIGGGYAAYKIYQHTHNDSTQTQQQGGNQEQGAEPEPQTSTSGAGARQGGGRSGQKSNADRQDSAKDKLEGARKDLAAAKASPPSKGRSETIKKAEAQVKHWQSKAAEKSENHSQKPKGQQQ